MSAPSDDAGTLQALIDRLVKFRLPRAVEIKRNVDAGAPLADSEMEFLQRALEDARDASKLVVRNPEIHALAGQITQLYGDIVRKAMENERG